MATLPFTTAFPGPYNVYQPGFGLKGKQTAALTISYARDPKKFAVNGLVMRTPVDYMSGLWNTLRPEALARVFTDPASVIWVDGQPCPDGKWNEQDFKAAFYQCFRRVFPDSVGWQTRDQAAWAIQDVKLQALAHIAMTQRALCFYNLTLTTANHLTTHVKTATQWSSIGGTGGFWSAGTESNPIIKRSLANICDQIRKDTMDTVNYLKLTAVVSPTAAIGMSNSEEIHKYVSESPFARAQIRGDEPSFNGQYGLPDLLYGMRIVVDGTLRTTSARLVVPGTTVDQMDDNTCLVMAYPGDISENVGQVTSAFSSVHMFVYRGEEMVTQTEDEPWNMRTKLRVSETYDMRIVSPETCGLITNLFS